MYMGKSYYSILGLLILYNIIFKTVIYYSDIFLLIIFIVSLFFDYSTKKINKYIYLFEGTLLLIRICKILYFMNII